MAIKAGTTAPDSEGDAVSTAAPSRRLLAFEALKIRHFRYLLVSDFFQMLGFNTRLMVQGWIVLELTDSDGWVGLVAGLPAIPVIILALFGGAISDRVNRRVIQIWTFLLLALSGYVLGLLVQTEAIRLWHLIAMAFLVSMMTTLRMTADSAMVVDVVGRWRIFGANALSTALGNVGKVCRSRSRGMGAGESWSGNCVLRNRQPPPVKRSTDLVRQSGESSDFCAKKVPDGRFQTWNSVYLRHTGT